MPNGPNERFVATIGEGVLRRQWDSKTSGRVGKKRIAFSVKKWIQEQLAALSYGRIAATPRRLDPVKPLLSDKVHSRPWYCDRRGTPLLLEIHE